MIKRYNQFVSGVKTNEEFIMPTKSDNYSDDMKSEMEPEMSQMPKMEEEEVAVDKYTLALQELSDLANEMGLIVEYSPENKFLTIEGKQVIFPTETERYHIDGVKKSFKTSQEVVDYFTKEIKAQEQSQDLPEMTNQPVQMEFESKSYKSNRYKR